MKLICILFMFGLTIQAFAFQSVEEVSVATAKRYLEKVKSCYVAVGIQGVKDKKKVMSVAYCVTDLTLGVGTIHPQTGCAIGLLNMETGRVEPTYDRVSWAPRFSGVNKRCADGWYDLLEKPAYVKTARKNYTVKETLKNGVLFQDAKSTPNTIFLYAASPGYKKLWDQLSQ